MYLMLVLSFRKQWHLLQHSFIIKLDLFHQFGSHSRSNVKTSCDAILGVKANCFLIQHIQPVQSPAQW